MKLILAFILFALLLTAQSLFAQYPPDPAAPSELALSYGMMFTALQWLGVALLGLLAHYAKKRMREGGDQVKITALWLNWQSSALTVLCVYTALYVALLMGEMTQVTAFLIGWTGDSALNTWTDKAAAKAGG